MTILLATTSSHKAREIEKLLHEVPGLKIETLADYPAIQAPIEDGESFAANARLKARFYAQRFPQTVLADDSGLEVNALGGAPGIHSARWVAGSDSDRNQALLKRLRTFARPERIARYQCALCLASGSDVIFETQSVCEGEIGVEIRGENGFGYDPVFVLTPASGAAPQWLGKTMAQVPPDVKSAISHRANAARHLAEFLKRELGAL